MRLFQLVGLAAVTLGMFSPALAGFDTAKTNDKPHQMVIIGAPGSGKGTHATYLANRFHIPHISTGDMLRAEIAKGSALGKAVKDKIAQGQLVEDELIIDILKARLAQPDAVNGYLLDGVPRTAKQLALLNEAGLAINKVVLLNVSDEEIVSRLEGRRIHAPSGRSYHLTNKPPKVPNVDDETGEPLIQRKDDKPEVIRKRLEAFHSQTDPVIAQFKSEASLGEIELCEVASSGPINLVKRKVAECFNH